MKSPCADCQKIRETQRVIIVPSIIAQALGEKPDEARLCAECREKRGVE